MRKTGKVFGGVPPPPWPLEGLYGCIYFCKKGSFVLERSGIKRELISNLQRNFSKSTYELLNSLLTVQSNQRPIGTINKDALWFPAWFSCLDLLELQVQLIAIL